jgi:hypothetical protein
VSLHVVENIRGEEKSEELNKPSTTSYTSSCKEDLYSKTIRAVIDEVYETASCVIIIPPSPPLVKGIQLNFMEGLMMHHQQ